MARHAFLTLLVLASVSVGACARDRYYHERYYDDRYGYDHRHQMDDRDAWEIVRNDPCRYDEYRRYAAKHDNPEKRREVMWKLAREGCSRPYEYDRDYYDQDREYLRR